MPKRVQKTATEIYAQQNKVLHMTMAKAGYPYNSNREVWQGLMAKAEGRPVKGLSSMTLGGRDNLIKAMQDKYPNRRIYNPPVPKRLRSWKKGAPEKSYEIRVEEDSQIRMIYALWAELGYEPKQLREMIRRMFKKDDIRWMDNKEIMILLNVLRKKLEKKGRSAVYYSDGLSEEEIEAEAYEIWEMLFRQTRAEKRAYKAKRREG